MRELPIIFSSEMIKSLLLDIKRETRRTKGLEKVNQDPDKWYRPVYFSHIKKWRFVSKDDNQETLFISPQYGLVNDSLYVKEQYYKSGNNFIKRYEKVFNGEDIIWKPAMYLPKKEARFWLKLTSVTINQLGRITRSECINEGIGRQDIQNKEFNLYEIRYFLYPFDNKYTSDPIESFKSLWKLYHNDPVTGWSNNPWVWELKFETIRK